MTQVWWDTAGNFKSNLSCGAFIDKTIGKWRKWPASFTIPFQTRPRWRIFRQWHSYIGFLMDSRFVWKSPTVGNDVMFGRWISEESADWLLGRTEQFESCWRPCCCCHFTHPSSLGTSRHYLTQLCQALLFGSCTFLLVPKIGLFDLWFQLVLSPWTWQFITTNPDWSGSDTLYSVLMLWWFQKARFMLDVGGVMKKESAVFTYGISAFQSNCSLCLIDSVPNIVAVLSLITGTQKQET